MTFLQLRVWLSQHQDSFLGGCSKNSSNSRINFSLISSNKRQFKKWFNIFYNLFFFSSGERTCSSYRMFTWFNWCSCQQCRGYVLYTNEESKRKWMGTNDWHQLQSRTHLISNDFSLLWRIVKNLIFKISIFLYIELKLNKFLLKFIYSMKVQITEMLPLWQNISVYLLFMHCNQKKN